MKQKWPGELFEHVWLETLIVANDYLDGERSNKNKGKKKVLSSIPYKIQQLSKLKEVIIGGRAGRNWEITDLTSLSKLQNLTTLYLYGNQITKVSLAWLKQLPDTTMLQLNENPIEEIPKNL